MTRWKVRVDWGILILVAVASAAVLRCEPICGKTIPHPDAESILVACVDYDALRKLNPAVPVPQGQRTQVLVTAKSGTDVKVSMGGMTRYGAINRDAWGRLVALVTFPGIEHQEVAVKIGEFR
jgi:hypothetical protein